MLRSKLRGAAAALIGGAALFGCVDGADVGLRSAPTDLPPALLGAAEAIDAASDAPASGQADPQDVLPSAASLEETSGAASKGRPIADNDLTVIQKRHLYAERVMTECVKAAPDFVAGLQASALQPTPPLANGARSFADRNFRVAASSNGRFCDVRALGGPLSLFADGMRRAFVSGGELLDWRREGERWRGAVVVGPRRFEVSARQESTSAGDINIAMMRPG